MFNKLPVQERGMMASLGDFEFSRLYFLWSNTYLWPRPNERRSKFEVR